jgi:prepilin-type N-terminal cleavage/methylation domain-containing protein
MSTLKNIHRQAKSRRDGKPAFTLLELIVVLLVLGILAAIAVPTFNRVKENSVQRVAQTTLEAAARNGEAIAKSDPDASDEEIATLVESEFADDSGLSVSVSGDTVTVSQSNGSAIATGSVEFNDGVPTITNATISGGSPTTTAAPTTTTTVAPVSYSVGDTGPGGGIVFITPSTSGNNTGLYFEAAPLTDVTQATWCSNTDTLLIGSITYGANFDIGTGASNTSTADAVCTSGAIQIAADYTNNGFSDWFLPSSTELIEMRNGIYNLGGVSGYYWSSTENIYQPGVAEAHDHASNTQSGLNKSSSNYVRPVRSFSA